MKRRLLPATIAAALVLAACGSGDDGDNSSGASAPAASDTTVSVQQVDGIGDVLVDANGLALYVSDEEADGTVRCVDGCTSFWIPLAPDDGAPTAATGVGDLGVIERPDGSDQVTAGGRPLYTFVEDSPGNVTGDGFSDDFGDQHLTWHAALADGSTSDSSNEPPSGYGY